MGIELPGVSIVAGMGGKIDPGGEATGDHGGNIFQTLGEGDLRIVGWRPIGLDHLLDSFLSDQGIHGSMLEECVTFCEGRGLAQGFQQTLVFHRATAVQAGPGIEAVDGMGGSSQKCLGCGIADMDTGRIGFRGAGASIVKIAPDPTGG